jgi:hypothetical protein
MGEQLGTSDLWWSGIGIPDPRHTIWADQCSYTPYDRVVAEVVPAQSTGLVLAATGTPSSSTALEFKAMTGGTPGIDGARFAWRESGASAWRGWIPPTRITWWSPVSASRTGRYPKALSLPNGKLLVVYGEDAGSTEQVTSYTYDPSTDAVSSDVIVHRVSTGGSTFGLHPTPLLLEDGTILVLSYRYEAGQVGITVHASEDSGATWRLWSESSIPTFDETPLRLSAAYANGQILLVTEWEDSFVVKGAAYASADLGITFTQVTGFDFNEKRHKTVVAAGGYFVLCWVLDDYNDTNSALGFQPRAARTANAFTPFGAVTNLSLYSQGAGSTGSSLDLVAPDVAVAVEESGAVWAYYTGRPGTQAKARAYRSADAGATWTSVPSGSDRLGTRWWEQTVDAYPWWISAAYHQGAVWMIGNRRSANRSANHDMMALVALGGWQTVTWGRKVQIPSDIGAPTWTATWLPLDDLDDAGSDFTVAVVSGTWTNVIESGAYHRSTGTASGDILTITEAPSASLEDLTVRASVEVVAGVLSWLVRIGDATESYEVRTELTAAGALSVYDPNNADSPTPVTGLTGRVDLMVTVGEYAPTGAYTAIVWYSATKGPHKAWTVARQLTLADGGGSSTWRTRFSLTGSGGVAADVKFYELHRLYAQDADPDDADGVGLVRLWHSSATYLPAPAPYGRALPGVRAAYAGNGISLRGSGRAAPGHTWTMTPGESYGPDRCLPASWPMASDRFRSTGSGAVAWLVDIQTARPHAPAWYFWIEGNVSQGTIAVHNGTSWADHATLDTRLTLTFQRTGTSVYANYTASSDIVDVAPFIDHGELVGGYFDLGGGDVRRIVRQTSGTRERNGNSSAERTKRIHLELAGIDGTEATSGTGYIRPPRALLLLKTQAMPTSIKGWRFTPSDAATAEGYWDYKAHMGPVHMVGRMPSWGSRLQVEHRNEENESPDGRWESTQLAPPRAIWTGGWADPIYRGSVQADSESPPVRGILVTDYDEYGTEAAPGYVLGYAEGELPGMLRGLLEELRGSATPIVWIPVAPRLWFESGVPTFNPYSWPWQGGVLATVQRQAGALYGVIVSDIDIQHQVGVEGIEDAVRLGTLEVRELR